MAKGSPTIRDAIVLGTLGLLVLGGGGWLLSGIVRQNVWLVNGLGVPVKIEIAGRSINVVAGGRTSAWLATGPHDVRVSTAHGVIEESPVVIPNGALVVYNVAGAAPLYTESVYYTSGQNADPHPSFTFHGGERWIVRDDVHYVFEPSPATLSVNKSSGFTRRYRFDVADGGWPTSVNYLAGHDRALQAIQICRVVAVAQPEEKRAADWAESLMPRVRGLEPGFNLARKALAGKPDDIMSHRRYQHYARLLGRSDEARARYRTAYQTDPSAQNATLLARMETAETAGGLLRGALAQSPDDAFARRGLSMLLFRTGDFPGTVSQLREVAVKDPDEYPHYAEDHARALVALGRAQEAAQVLADLGEKTPELDWSIAVAYALVARLPGVVPPKPARIYIDRHGKKNPDLAVWMTSFAEAELTAAQTSHMKDEEMRAAAEIQSLAGIDPKGAWEACRKAPAGALRQLAPVVALLLGAEFDRVGDSDLADLLFHDASPTASLSPGALRAYAREGSEDFDLWRLDPELRAALDLTRARRRAADGQDATAVYDAVARGDVLHGVVRRALGRWPKPAKPAVDALIMKRVPAPEPPRS
jgi:hypothetical protein